jgi:hypothetical protein
MIHNHRVIPGYEGGEYVEGNVVPLSLTQHAMWHFAEWTRKGNFEDRLAYQFLSGQITAGEAHELAVKMGARKGGEITKAAKKGICDPSIGSLGRKKVHDSGQPREMGLKQGKANVENGHLAHVRTLRPLNKEKFRCLKTGKVSYPGPLTCYQKARGIDTSLRERVYD